MPNYICRNSKQIFKGNDDAKSTSKQELPVPIEAKYIRIYPVEYEGWMCLRAELYGKGTNCTKARPCDIGNIVLTDFLLVKFLAESFCIIVDDIILTYFVVGRLSALPSEILSSPTSSLESRRYPVKIFEIILYTEHSWKMVTSR